MKTKSKKSKTKKVSKRKSSKRKSSKKKTSKRKSSGKIIETIYIREQKQPSFKRVAGENAVGGLAAGFGVAAGHEFGDWLFD